MSIAMGSASAAMDPIPGKNAALRIQQEASSTSPHLGVVILLAGQQQNNVCWIVHGLKQIHAVVGALCGQEAHVVEVVLYLVLILWCPIKQNNTVVCAMRCMLAGAVPCAVTNSQRNSRQDTRQLEVHASADAYATHVVV
eukprot:1145847-Pelagomonas_calceolata.AAC.3